MARLDAGLRSCAFLPNGVCIAAACDDGSLRVFDVQSGGEVMAFFGDAPVHAVATTPGGLPVAGDAVGRPLLLRLNGRSTSLPRS